MPVYEQHGTAERPVNAINVAECLALARRQGGRSYASLVSEILRLGWSFGKLSPEDYFAYRLYDDRAYDPAAKRSFLSDRIHSDICHRCNDVRWWGMADDKLIADLILHKYPTPITQAAYSKVPRVGATPILTDAAELAKFLREEGRYPLFAKPIGGYQSRGAWLVEDIDRGADHLLLHGGEAVPVDGFVQQLVAAPGTGYVFQDRLEPHPELAAICGDRISTIRFVMMIPDREPELIHTVWKIPVGGNVADNFWRPGNMLANLDGATGKVVRVVQGVGPQQEERETHPDTGRPILGYQIPDWQEIKDLVQEVAQIFPRLRYHGWDVALTAAGPVLVEVNTGTSFTLPQFATGKGMLDEKFRDFIGRYRHGKPVATRNGRH